MTFSLSPGPRALSETALIAATLAGLAAASPTVRRAAEEALAESHAKTPSREEEMRAIGAWVAARSTWTADSTSAEEIRSPLELLREISTGRRARADCDCLATLTAALLASVGVPSGIAVVAVTAAPGSLDSAHMVAVGLDDAGTWRIVDPSAALAARPLAEAGRIIDLVPLPADLDEVPGWRAYADALGTPREEAALRRVVLDLFHRGGAESADKTAPSTQRPTRSSPRSPRLRGESAGDALRPHPQRPAADQENVRLISV